MAKDKIPYSYIDDIEKEITKLVELFISVNDHEEIRLIKAKK